MTTFVINAVADQTQPVTHNAKRSFKKLSVRHQTQALVPWQQADSWECPFSVCSAWDAEKCVRFGLMVWAVPEWNWRKGMRRSTAFWQNSNQNPHTLLTCAGLALGHCQRILWVLWDVRWTVYGLDLQQHVVLMMQHNNNTVQRCFNHQSIWHHVYFHILFPRILLCTVLVHHTTLDYFNCKMQVAIQLSWCPHRIQIFGASEELLVF